MTTQIMHADPTEMEFEYRALHTGAVLGAILGVVSSFILLTAGTTFDACLMIAPIPLIGMFVSLRSWSSIRRQSDQFTGIRLAMLGFFLSLFFLLSGLSYGGYVYATEVPDGYERISFVGLKPDQLDERAGRPVPEEITALVGEKVFIKGYIRPESAPYRTGIDSFLLVRDNNQCCFGDLSQVKYFDQMQVVMQGPLRVDYSTGIFRMGGILRILPQNLALGKPIFFLEADYAN